MLFMLMARETLCRRSRRSFDKGNLQGVAGFPVVDAAAGFEMEEEKEKSKFDQQPSFVSK